MKRSWSVQSCASSLRADNSQFVRIDKPTRRITTKTGAASLAAISNASDLVVRGGWVVSWLGEDRERKPAMALIQPATPPAAAMLDCNHTPSPNAHAGTIKTMPHKPVQHTTNKSTHADPRANHSRSSSPSALLVRPTKSPPASMKEISKKGGPRVV